MFGAAFGGGGGACCGGRVVVPVSARLRWGLAWERASSSFDTRIHMAGPSARVTWAYSTGGAREGGSEFDRESEFVDSLSTEQIAAFTSQVEAAYHIRYDEKERQPVVCDACTGTGEGECQWCAATGFMQLNGLLVCETNGNSTCLVCRGEGIVKCKPCLGTGHKAGWMKRRRGKASNTE